MEIQVSLVKMAARAIHQVKISGNKSLRKSSVDDAAILQLSYSSYFLFLSTVGRFIALRVRVSNAFDLDQVASFARFLALLLEQFIYPIEASIFLVMFTLLGVLFAS